MIPLGRGSRQSSDPRVMEPSTQRPGRCQGWLHLTRPERGPVIRCTHRAKFYVPMYDLRVCGFHARAYLTVVPLSEAPDA